MERIPFDLELFFKYGFYPSYQTDYSILSKRIKESDFLISDDTCTHRLIGLHYKRGSIHAPMITVICTRNEMAYAKKIAFENGKRIYMNSKVSAILFKKYPVGKEINPEDFSYVVNFYANYYESLASNRSINSY